MKQNTNEAPHLKWYPVKKDTHYLDDLHRKLKVAMSRIDNINNSKWHYYRKLLNVYDFTSRTMASNRAFYKLWEVFKVIPELDPEKIHKSCHLAEAPGSFVEVTNKLAPNAYKLAVSKPPMLYSEVLVNSRKIPMFSNSIVNNVSNARFEYLDLLNVIQLEQFIKMHDSKFDFITADGGIDDYENYFDKERMHFKLILAEMVSILFLLKKGGNCIVKIFDCYTQTTMHLIYFLAKHFSQFDIIKPITSRPTNSEKYLVCLNYQGTDHNLSECLDLINDIPHEQDFVLSQFIPDEFVTFVLHKVSLYINNQINTINQTVDYIKLPNKQKIAKKKLYATKDKVFQEWQTNFELH